MSPRARWRLLQYGPSVGAVVVGVACAALTFAHGRSGAGWNFVTYTLLGLMALSTARSAEHLYRNGYWRGRIEQLQQLSELHETGVLPVVTEEASDPWRPAPWRTPDVRHERGAP